MDEFSFNSGGGTAQSTACEHRFLLLVEADGAELLPVTD